MSAPIILVITGPPLWSSVVGYALLHVGKIFYAFQKSVVDTGKDLSPLSKVLFEKLMVARMDANFSVFHGTRLFMAAAGPTQSLTPYFRAFSGWVNQPERGFDRTPNIVPSLIPSPILYCVV